MSDRGEYRSFYVSIADDETVHAMSDRAWRALSMLKLSLPAIGIGVVYPAVLAQRCNCTLKQLEAALVELETPKPGERLGWIVREKNIVWLVNGLKHEPTLSVANIKKHRPFVRRLLANLSESASVVLRFRAHYAVWFTDAPPSAPEDNSARTEPHPKAEDSLTIGYPKANDSLTKHCTELNEPELHKPELPTASVIPDARPAPDVTADVSASEIALRRRLPAPYWLDLDALLDSRPADARRSWCARLTAHADGQYAPHATPEQLGEAVREFVAKAPPSGGLKLFAGYVRGVVAPPRETGPPGAPAAPGTAVVPVARFPTHPSAAERLSERSRANTRIALDAIRAEREQRAGRSA